jgi:hypothetical protein
MFWEVAGLDRGPLSLVRIIEELLEWNCTYCESLCWCLKCYNCGLNLTSYLFFFFKMFDIISDYKSATSSDRICRMNSMVGYVILCNNNNNNNNNNIRELILWLWIWFGLQVKRCGRPVTEIALSKKPNWIVGRNHFTFTFHISHFTWAISYASGWVENQRFIHSFRVRRWVWPELNPDVGDWGYLRRVQPFFRNTRKWIKARKYAIQIYEKCCRPTNIMLAIFQFLRKCYTICVCVCIYIYIYIYM